MIFTQITSIAMLIMIIACLRDLHDQKKLVTLQRRYMNVTHNQVSYWDSIYKKRNQEVSNSIAAYDAETQRFKAEREEYWTHKNYNWNESMFGYQLFKDLSSNIITMALFG